jgi:hypothetical protein
MDAFTKTLRDGRTAVVSVAVSSLNMTYTTIRIDGEEVGSHVGPHHAAPKEALKAAGPEYVAAIGPLLLTAEQAAQIEAVYNEVRATIPANLNFAREQLVRAVNIAGDAWAAAQAAAQDNDTMGSYYAGPDARHQDAIAKAEQALADFDAAHPEIAAGLRRQREADVIRWAAL